MSANYLFLLIAYCSRQWDAGEQTEVLPSVSFYYRAISEGIWRGMKHTPREASFGLR